MIKTNILLKWELKSQIIQTSSKFSFYRPSFLISSIRYLSDAVKKNPKVFFDVSANNQPLGRITMELNADIVPKTAGWVN